MEFEAHLLLGLLICTQIYENQGLEKSRSIPKPRKISGLAPGFFLVLYYKPIFFSWWRLEKISRFAEPEIFPGFEIDLDYSRP